jgi:hypothetical protein
MTGRVESREARDLSQLAARTDPPTLIRSKQEKIL